MSLTAYRVRGGVICLNEQMPLAECTEVLVTPLASAPSSPAAIVAAMDNSPKVPVEWVDELERAIASGRLTPAPPVTFTEEPVS
jgi:hypothetical protein